MSSGADHCTRAEHEALKQNDAAWDGLEWRPSWAFEGEVLEQRNCRRCGSTLARPKRLVFLRKTADGPAYRMTIAEAVAHIRHLKRIDAKPGDGRHAHCRCPVCTVLVRRRRRIERALLELCERKGP